MTTGRINQVTILSGEAEARPATPRGRVVHLMAIDAIASASQQLAPRGPKPPHRVLTTIQLPPLSFPQAGPLHKCSGVETASHSATCNPQEEDTGHRSRQKRISAWAYPRIVLYKSSHRPSIYRIQPRPPDKLTGLTALRPTLVLPSSGLSSALPPPIRLAWVFLACAKIVTGWGLATKGPRYRDESRYNRR